LINQTIKPKSYENYDAYWAGWGVTSGKPSSNELASRPHTKKSELKTLDGVTPLVEAWMRMMAFY